LVLLPLPSAPLDAAELGTVPFESPAPLPALPPEPEVPIDSLLALDPVAPDALLPAEPVAPPDPVLSLASIEPAPPLPLLLLAPLASRVSPDASNATVASPPVELPPPSPVPNEMSAQWW
jgi:hypothetical protein